MQSYFMEYNSLNHLIMKNLIFVPLACLLIAACQSPSVKDNSGNTPTVSPDSLTNAWITSWNQPDSAAVRGAFQEDALAFMDTIVPAIGMAAMDTQWLNHNIGLVHNIVIRPLSSESDGQLAFGSYSGTLDFTENNKHFNQRFALNLLWKKQPDNNWKIAFIQINSVDTPANN